MGKPIIEAVYLRDIQRQCLAWCKEFRDDKNKGSALLVEHSTAQRKNVEVNDQDGRTVANKIADTANNTITA